MSKGGGLGVRDARVSTGRPTPRTRANAADPPASCRDSGRPMRQQATSTTWRLTQVDCVDGSCTILGRYFSCFPFAIRPWLACLSEPPRDMCPESLQGQGSFSGLRSPTNSLPLGAEVQESDLRDCWLMHIQAIRAGCSRNATSRPRM